MEREDTRDKTSFHSKFTVMDTHHTSVTSNLIPQVELVIAKDQG